MRTTPSRGLQRPVTLCGLIWLATLSDQYGVQVQIIEVAREGLAPGLVKVRRLQLSRSQ